ncbi:MAG: hypothetical protein IPL10_19405 [Bacteroidetes bacterium]|nr:hypothetical protein [Bacteroidota bacterium]
MKKIYRLGAACLLWASLALGQTTVKSYTTSGSFVIPSCVTSITITARGAAGSNGAQGQTTLCPGGIGGYGAIVSGVYSVTQVQL